MKKTTTNIPAAVFMQVPLDEGFTTEDVNKMLSLLKLSPNEQFSFLEIPRRVLYRAGYHPRSGDGAE